MISKPRKNITLLNESFKMSNRVKTSNYLTRAKTTTEVQYFLYFGEILFF